MFIPNRGWTAFHCHQDFSLFEAIFTLAICGFAMWLTWPFWAMLLAWLWWLVCSAGWFLAVVGIFIVVDLFKK